LYLPASQAAHAPVCVRAKPATHTQSLARVLSAAEFAFSGQRWHVTAPAAAEKLPAAQDEHVSAATAPSTAEYLPAAQDKHAPMSTAPSPAEYLPATQDEHAPLSAAPIPAEYLPASQSVHIDSPVS